MKTTNDPLEQSQDSLSRKLFAGVVLIAVGTFLVITSPRPGACPAPHVGRQAESNFL